jgi:hypothetical protein
MLRAAPVAVFLEPEPGLYPLNLRGAVSRLRARRMDRLRGLRDHLGSLGVLVDARRLGVGDNPLNETCLLVAQRRALQDVADPDLAD